MTAQVRRALRIVAIAVVTLAPAGAGLADDPRSLEFNIKATFLYKFAPYVEWPSFVFPSPSSPLYLCIAGMPAFNDFLDRAVQGQHFNAHPIEVRRYDTIDGQETCHIMFVAGSPTQSVADILTMLRDRPILTVTDLPAEAPAKGIINFVIRDNHVRFEIDARAAAAHDLEISSRLLTLAVLPERRD